MLPAVATAWALLLTQSFPSSLDEVTAPPPSAGHTLVNPDLTQPGDDAPKRSARLIEINDELDRLTNYKTPGMAFGEAASKLAPFWVVLALPALVLAYFGADSHDGGTSEALWTVAGAAVLAGVVLLGYCVFVAIGAWIDDLPNSVDRQQKVERLMRERDELIQH